MEYFNQLPMFGEEIKALGDSQTDLPVEACPKCEAALIEKWSGVKCSNDNCDYWFCF